jgi:hypothetical protein
MITRTLFFRGFIRKPLRHFASKQPQGSKYPLQKPVEIVIETSDSSLKGDLLQGANQMAEVIKHEIKTGGKPMSLARFMELGLLHPEHGYYSTKEKIFSKGGDFVTSPEIS